MSDTDMIVRPNPEPGGVSWQSVSHTVIAVALALGGWAWSATTAQLVQLQAEQKVNAVQIASLSARADAQTSTNAEQRVQLRRLEDKLDAMNSLLQKVR